MTNDFTASGTSPHPDSRHLTWDFTTGSLLHSNDGGVFVRTHPRENTGDWHSLNGDLAIGEFVGADFYGPDNTYAVVCISSRFIVVVRARVRACVRSAFSW